jgi:hypothetical protein
MKKLTLLLALSFFSITAYSQVDTTTLSADNKMILKTFKDLHVDKTFKDPYSFELMKIESFPITFGDWVRSDMEFVQKQLQNNDFGYTKNKKELEAKIKEAEERLNNHKIKLEQMDPELRDAVKAFKVKMDAYGSNSYGNRVLSKYEFNYLLYGLDKSMKVDYYATPGLFRVK